MEPDAELEEVLRIIRTTGETPANYDFRYLRATLEEAIATDGIAELFRKEREKMRSESKTE
ncbi:MAG: hypothetical protein ACI4LA_05540 [Emergencia sp.]